MLGAKAGNLISTGLDNRAVHPVEREGGLKTTVGELPGRPLPCVTTAVTWLFTYRKRICKGKLVSERDRHIAHN